MDSNNKTKRDPLDILLNEPPTLQTDVLDFLLRVGLQRAISSGPPAYVNSKDSVLQAQARRRCHERVPTNMMLESRMLNYVLGGRHFDELQNVADLHLHFGKAAPYNNYGHFGLQSGRMLNDMLVEQGLQPIFFGYYTFQKVNKHYFANVPRRT